MLAAASTHDARRWAGWRYRWWVGVWVLAQFGLGQHVWSTTRQDAEAVEYFRALGEQIGFF